MCVQTEAYRIPGSHPPTWNDSHGPNQNPRRGRLATTNHSHQCTILLGFHWVLPVFHTQLLENRKTPLVANTKRHAMGMGRRSKTGVRTPEDPNVPAPRTGPTKLQ